MPISDEQFLYDVGDHVFYEAHGGVLMRVVIMRRLAGRNMPEYQIRSVYAPDSEGVSCLQYWLRRIPMDRAELRKYMEERSPPMTPAFNATARRTES